MKDKNGKEEIEFGIVEITGIISLVKQGIRYNKKTVTIPKSSWELIETILERLKFTIKK